MNLLCMLDASDAIRIASSEVCPLVTALEKIYNDFGNGKFESISAEDEQKLSEKMCTGEKDVRDKVSALINNLQVIIERWEPPLELTEK